MKVLFDNCPLNTDPREQFVEWQFGSAAAHHWKHIIACKYVCNLKKRKLKKHLNDTNFALFPRHSVSFSS